MSYRHTLFAAALLALCGPCAAAPQMPRITAAQDATAPRAIRTRGLPRVIIGMGQHD